MDKTWKQRAAFFVAGLFAGLIILHAGMSIAGSDLPLPERKPTYVSFPVPSVKPAYIVEAAEEAVVTENVSLNLDENFSDIPFPMRKPGQHALSVLLPSSPLSETDEKLYTEIFALHANGQMEEAGAKIKELENGLLMGHILAQRYLHPATHTTFDDLKDWLERYSDHPQAEKIMILAQRRQPDDFSGTLKQPQAKSPIRGSLGAVSHSGKVYRSRAQRSEEQHQAVVLLERRIRKHIQNYEPTQALTMLKTEEASQFMDDVEYDHALGLISAGYLYAGKLDDAQRYAEAAVKRSGQYVPMAGWVSGLVHWQHENYKKAAQSFELSASSPYASGWLVSASGYWASRAHMRSGNVRVVSKWLRLSASFPRTFYGLIATRALGQDYDFNWERPSVTQSHRDAIEASEHGQRAQALIQIGQIARAEAELRQMYSDDPKLQAALLAYAYEYKLPALTMRLGHAVLKPEGGLYDAALYPVMPWEPQKGYRLDKALIHAFIRQESKFSTEAESHSGATGLMQLMPATASYIADNSIYKDAQGIYQLRDPRTNLEIGQTYLERLLNDDAVGQDLLSLAIAYNAGPGNLARWKRERKHITDPLMFIETIPYAETRAFVERVLSNYWIYRLQMEQPVPSLDAVAEGRWARYAQADSGVKFAGK